jgi:hypothetical protein
MESARCSFQILIKQEFCLQVSKNIEIQSFMRIGPMGAALFHADRRTDWRTEVKKDMTKQTAAFRNLANAPEKEK